MGNETRKAYEKRLARGDFSRYLVGRGLDIGAGEDPLRPPNATVDTWDLAQGDAQVLQTLGKDTYDFVYSSHCLEHMRSIDNALENWIRVLRPGGFLYLVVPDYTLYEKDEFPSRFNPDHKHTFSLDVSRREVGRMSHWHIAEDLIPLLNRLGVSYIKAFLEDDHFDYSLDRKMDQTHFQDTLAQICIVGRKLESFMGSRAGPQLRSPPALVETSLSPEPHSGRNFGSGVVSLEPLRIYTGILGQIGDIVMFTATARRIKQLFPNSRLTFAVSRRFREAGELIEGLPYVDRVFVTELYFEKLAEKLYPIWNMGWPVDLRGEDESREQETYDLVFETRPRHREATWWRHAHQVEECARTIGVPGPIYLQTEIAIPPRTVIPEETKGKLVIHNDPSIDSKKAWPWEYVRQLVKDLGPSNVVMVGNQGPTVEGTIDYRGRTTLAQAAMIISCSRCFIGIDSGPMWISGSLQVPTIGLYGTSYIPALQAVQPVNPNATYLQAEGPMNLITPQQVYQSLRTKVQQGQVGSP